MKQNEKNYERPCIYMQSDIVILTLISEPDLVYFPSFSFFSASISRLHADLVFVIILTPLVCALGVDEPFLHQTEMMLKRFRNVLDAVVDSEMGLPFKLSKRGLYG